MGDQANSLLLISRLFLAAIGSRTFVYHADRIPSEGGIIVVSNHRSFMDPLLLTVAVNRQIKFACHHYMGQVPVLREMVTGLGCFPLDNSSRRQQGFFRQATQLLQAEEMVGVFPEGAAPMVRCTPPNLISDFQRGFAHLALRSPVANLAILPVAIASSDEQLISSRIPLKLLSFFDPSEPLFNQPGWHPAIVYQRSNIMFGRPFWVKSSHRQQYHGKYAKQLVNNLTDYVSQEIANLLIEGCI
ncbi:MAG: 1-acyl-sn-glycerol-3-phosphate acyltransferase [Okeania sp. SIO3H1]|uniref:lysophospholipid acyltransferase family protein n=1 Tax=Okeania sp. SIO1I7 TaxID=2607772 RepID=UPI0013CA405D|nr:lysophospholipid acyltransferase family protein [Okeania sp. SIO1I7]NEN91963.1 1-acyl-sn-glycerol-3-phosphate acyltransferase [Okeania sp. SIO3H1]NET28883.1 1-acyl-sn-glycerol-3-phosphate acyltransferase [Okeania sp. SIO1I7]